MDKSPRVLYVMYGMPSCYNNGLAFARRFLDDDVAITVACDQDVSALAAAAKVPFRHLKSLSYAQTTRRYLDITQSKKTNRIRNLLSSYRVVRDCKKLRQRTLEDDELLQLIAELNPDVLLIDIECHLAIIASSTLSKPTALCTRLFNHRPGDNVAPLHSDLLPSKQFAKRLLIAAQWWKLRVQSTVIAARQRFSKRRIMPIHYRSYSMPDIKAMANRYKVDLWSIATRTHWFRPVAYTHAPILSMTLSELDFDRREDHSFKYLGPMIGEQDYTFDFQTESIEKIDRFIDTAKHDGRKIIYCAMGTYAQSQTRFVEIVETLVRLKKDYAFIISLGGRGSVDARHQIPDNALLLDAAPQLKCLANSDAAILHGGIASLHEALKFCVPVLCFSVGSNDQNGTATRWVYRKLAIRFSAASISAVSLGLKLDQLLDDAEIANQTEWYSRLLEKSRTDFSPQKLVSELCT